jgi:hypothetical protein
MNYLAHTYLSFGHSGIVTGNLISDFVKGKKQFEFSPRIRIGIKLHRAIDAFTDTHEATADIKQFFRPHYRLFSGAFADIVYDHFLALDKNIFSSQQDMDDLVQQTHAHLTNDLKELPDSFLPVFNSMKTHNWLGLYQYDAAIQKSFKGLQHRTKYIEEIDTAFNIFLNNKKSMQAAYNDFFPLLKKYSIETLEVLMHE